MTLEWTFTAQSFLDQLPHEDRAKVQHAVARLSTGWSSFGESRLTPLQGDQQGLYSLKVGADLRVVVQRLDEVISVVDVVRRSQVDGLRRLRKAAS